MYCNTVEECFNEINAYCGGSPWGYSFFIDVENYNDFQTILQRLEADASKRCVYISQFINTNGLPSVIDAMQSVTGIGSYVLIGISQALMLQSEEALNNCVGELIEMSISGHVIVLLSHCKKILSQYLQKDIRIDRRVAFVKGNVSPLPQINLVSDIATCIGFKPLNEIKGLLTYMEHMNDDNLAAHPELTVLTHFNPVIFRQSMYMVHTGKGAYDAIYMNYPDLRLSDVTNGTAEQWEWLLSEIKDKPTFAAYICDKFGNTTNLIAKLSDAIQSNNKNILWSLWLGMKMFGCGNNSYISRILSKESTAELFIEEIYNELLNIKYDDSAFNILYNEREKIIEELPEDLTLIDQYCDQIGKYEKDAVWYLTPDSEREKYELVKCFAIYDYDAEEIHLILDHGFEDLSLYMNQFIFDSINTKLPDSDVGFREELNEYFKNYKIQKLTNRIYDEFLIYVNQEAEKRQFMLLQPRSSIVSKIDKEKTGFFFFDALGVEFLAFIQSKCEKYGLICEIQIGHCELPSITSENKEFELTCKGIKKISDLDDLKHHSSDYDYTKCKYPIHIFKELEIIDKELRKIQSQLSQGIIERAVILSDHGASRLAVLYGKEISSSIELDESGEHSGRCCKTDIDPKLPQATYENGYAVLANYERFKGGRRANVEVHGGASLEEVLIPIITLTRMPTDIAYCFVDPVIIFQTDKPSKITLFCNIPMKQPRIQVNGIFYNGVFTVDNKHAVFTMPELKRTNTYDANIYEGDKNVGVTLSFKLERKTKIRDLFG